MKRKYQQPAMQEEVMNVNNQILAGSHIGEGGEGQQGDVKGLGSLEESGKSIFEENPFQ